MNKHLDLLGYFYIALGVLGVLAAFGVLIIVVGGGLLSGDQEAILITGVVGTVVAAFITLVSLPGFIAGYGLLKRRSWARALILVLAILNLFNFPLGTALGLYTFWVLLQDETIDLLST